MKESIFNVTKATLDIHGELYLFQEIKGVQTVSIGIAKEGFKPVYEPEVQRLARMLSEIEADVESFKVLLP